MRAANIFDFPDWFYGVTLRYKPWPHQIDDLKFAMKHERFGLFNDAGVGKTLSIQALLILYCSGYGNKGVVCMPPALIGQFMESFFDDGEDGESYFINLKEHVNFKAYAGTKKKKDKMWEDWEREGFPEVLIMSYRAFSDMHPIKARKEKLVRNSATGHERIIPAVKPLRNHPLKDRDFNVLFFDEAHALKNVGSGIHKKVYRYIGNTDGEFLLGLFTGSPIANTLVDAYGMIHLITPEVYSNLRIFERRHCLYARNTDFKTLIGYQNQDELHTNLYLHARRVTKQEGLKDLPPMIPEAIPIRLSATHLKWYKKLLTERVLELPDQYIDATQAQKLRQVALQMITVPEQYIPVKVENEVFNALNEKVESINPLKNKIIIFSYFTETVNFLAEKYKEYNPAVINGKSGNKDKARLKFVNDNSCRMVIINWLSGGAGLNLQISNYLFFYEQPTVPSQALQAIARSHRGGQDLPVNVGFFKVFGTLMAKSLKQLLQKDYDVNTVVQDKHKMLYELLGENVN